MLYHRTFRFSAAHFNSKVSYDAVWSLNNDPLVLDAVRMHHNLVDALRDVHGHNFKIVLRIEGMLDDGDWLIDDVEIEKIVMEWSNTNLSMHPDFISGKLRATTERMAEVLYHKINHHLGETRPPYTLGQCTLVQVYETDDIFAEEG